MIACVYRLLAKMNLMHTWVNKCQYIVFTNVTNGYSCSHTGLRLTSDQLDALFSGSTRLRFLKLFKPSDKIAPPLLEDTLPVAAHPRSVDTAAAQASGVKSLANCLACLQ